MGETLLMRQAGEPSVEEILESIKKVIARDTRDEAARERSGREEATRARDGRAEAAQHRAQRERAIPVSLAPAAPAVAMPQPAIKAPLAAEPPVDDESVLELTEAEDSPEPDFDDLDDDAIEAENHVAERSAMDEDAAKPLVAETAVASMRESLAALALLSQPGAAPQIVRSGETSLEGLTRDLLRPMLAQWLESNLPPMVERLVAVEIARIAGKKG